MKIVVRGEKGKKNRVDYEKSTRKTNAS